MPEVTSYEPGAFCWVELATSDPKNAKSFYTKLYAWDVKDIPMGDQGTYHIFQKEGKDVGAMYQLSAEEQGVPPHWNNYVAVADADASTAKAKSLGGTVVAGPFDVMDAGRMAFISDPQGAMFAIWQKINHIGAMVVNEPAAFCWNELMTTDVEGARKFYAGLFGWKYKVSPEYTEIVLGGRSVAGMMQIRPEMQGMPSNWIPYFAVEDTDTMAKKAQSAGAHVGVPPTDIPNAGRFSVLADPQGARFAIIKLIQQ
jgi:uncharacterized protein